MDFKGFVQSFKIHTAPIPFTEKLRNGLIGGTDEECGKSPEVRGA